jgi:hypothetical protein
MELQSLLEVFIPLHKLHPEPERVCPDDPPPMTLDSIEAHDSLFESLIAGSRFSSFIHLLHFLSFLLSLPHRLFLFSPTVVCLFAQLTLILTRRASSFVVDHLFADSPYSSFPS